MNEPVLAPQSPRQTLAQGWSLPGSLHRNSGVLRSNPGTRAGRAGEEGTVGLVRAEAEGLVPVFRLGLEATPSAGRGGWNLNKMVSGYFKPLYERTITNYCKKINKDYTSFSDISTTV